MPESVVIDGQRFVPEGESLPRVGIAITTRDRPEQLQHCLEQIRKHTPDAETFPVFVVDDASKVPAPADYRFEENVGIPRAKNKCLELLMDAGVDHLFLFDNDAYPIADDWWRPFVESPEPHLMAQFLDLEKQKLNDIRVIYQDDELVAYTGPRGYCLYYERHVIEDAGGFDPIFGKGLYEHGDLSNRIFMRGHTTFRYAAPAGVGDLIESGDRLGTVQRTPLPDRVALVERNRELHSARYYDVSYAPYREESRAYVLTSLLTGLPDPQRGTRLTATAEAVQGLVESRGSIPVVVLADELESVPGATVVPVPTTVNPYYARWVQALKWMQANDFDYALLCDSTDVRLLQPERLRSLPEGKILVGSENQVLDCKWMRDNHPHPLLQSLLDSNGEHALLNSGCLAGARADLIEFVRRLVHHWQDGETDEWNGDAGACPFEMGWFNYVALTYYRDRILFGPWVHTEFKAEQDTHPTAFLKHK